MKPAVEWKIISRRTEKVEREKKCFTEFSLLTLIIHDRVLHPTHSVECEATNCDKHSLTMSHTAALGRQARDNRRK